MTWTTVAEEQRAIIARIEGKLNKIKSVVSPITVYSETQPTDAEISAAWAAAYPPAYSPGMYEEIQWVQPSTNTMRNRLMRIADISGTGSTGVQQPLATYPVAPIPFTKLGEIYIPENTTGSGTQTITVTDTTFNDLCLSVQLRDTVAAVSATAQIRVNLSSSAIYAASWQGANSAFSLGNEVNSQAGWQLTIPGANSARTYYHQGLLWMWDYATADRSPRIHYRGTSLWGNPYTSATTTNYNYFAIHNNAVAVTSISLFSVTGWAAGTRLVLYGV